MLYEKNKPNNSTEKILKKKNTRKKGKYKGSGIYQLTCKDFHKKMHLSTIFHSNKYVVCAAQCACKNARWL